MQIEVNSSERLGSAMAEALRAAFGRGGRWRTEDDAAVTREPVHRYLGELGARVDCVVQTKEGVSKGASR